MLMKVCYTILNLLSQANFDCQMSCIAKKVHWSSPLQTALKKFCQNFTINYHQPHQNVSMQLNSTAEMLDSFILLQKAVDDLCKDQHKLHKYKLTELEWQIAEQLHKILKVCILFALSLALRPLWMYSNLYPSPSLTPPSSF